jgi:cytochrome c oxidase cbb3-type subunit 3
MVIGCREAGLNRARSFPRRFSAAAILAVLLFSCNEEKRSPQVGPAAASVMQATPQSDLQAGVPWQPTRLENPFAKNQLAISEGKRLFSNFNCAGCHSSNGGGGMAPPLIDSEWIYGSEPANVFDTIVKGRPNGMPSFSGKIPEYQIWQIVAYLESIRLDPPSSGRTGKK